MDELVKRLSEENRSVSFQKPEATSSALQSRIELGYVHILFDETDTELGIKINPKHSDLSAADFEKGTGIVKLVGGITLNFEKVKCIAEIDLATTKGKGYLVPLGEEEYDMIMQIEMV